MINCLKLLILLLNTKIFIVEKVINFFKKIFKKNL